MKSQVKNGFMIELDYALRPRVREGSAERNDFCGRLIAKAMTATALTFSLCLN